MVQPMINGPREVGEEYVFIPTATGLPSEKMGTPEETAKAIGTQATKNAQAVYDATPALVMAALAMMIYLRYALTWNRATQLGSAAASLEGANRFVNSPSIRPAIQATVGNVAYAGTKAASVVGLSVMHDWHSAPEHHVGLWNAARAVAVY